MEIGQRGKRTLKTLGRYPQLSFADARALARQLQVQPSPANASVTFREALGADYSTECRNMGERHRNEVQRILTKQFSIIHAKPLPDLKTCDLTAIIDKMTPSVANHAYGAIKTFLTWCRRRKLILSNPLEDMNVPYKMQSRDRILSDAELPCASGTPARSSALSALSYRSLIWYGMPARRNHKPTKGVDTGRRDHLPKARR